MVYSCCRVVEHAKLTVEAVWPRHLEKHVEGGCISPQDPVSWSSGGDFTISFSLSWPCLHDDKKDPWCIRNIFMEFDHVLVISIHHDIAKL